MIRTLQIKFVKTAMTAITVLLLVVICATCGIYTFQVRSEVTSMARMLARNGGVPVPPNGGAPRSGGESGDSFDEEFDDYFEDYFDEGNAEGGQHRAGDFSFRGRGRISPDNAMAARFFLVHMDQEGAIDYTDTSKIYSVSSEEANEMALEAAASGRTSGIRDRFLYYAEEGDAGKTVVFMDISTEISSILSVVVISLIIALICWVLMFVLVTVLSRRAIAPIAENIVRQKQFVTNAGHELKTPLAIIMSNTEALELFNGESKWTRNIKSQTRRLSVLMQNLLTLSKMDEADLELPMEELDLGDLVGEAASAFEEPAREKKIEYQVDAPHIKARAHKETIRQLVGILLDNAVKYTPEGGSISVTVRQEEKYAVIRQENTVDPGDIEEDPEKLFDRFYRRDKARTQKKGGYGIGLSAARAIAAANHAEITARYNGQESIVFSVKLMI